MWIEHRSNQYRAYWRNPAGTPKKLYEPFADREAAGQFVKLVNLVGISSALEMVRGTGSVPSAAPTSAVEVRPRAAAQSPAGPMTAAVSGLTGFTFAQLWKRFLEVHASIRPSTRKEYEAYGRLHLLPFFGTTDLALIKKGRRLDGSDVVPGAVYVRDWVQQMQSKPKTRRDGTPMVGTHLSSSTVTNVKNTLQQALQLAIDEGYIDGDNAARRVTVQKSPAREMLFLEGADDAAALRDAIHPHFAPLVDFLVGTGVRFGEAAALLVKEAHLDAPTPYVVISKTLKYENGKLERLDTKTEKSRRRIALPARLVEVIRPLVDGRAGEDFLFTMIGGGRLRHSNFYQRYYQPARRKAGNVPDTLRIHDLRHTHAAWLMKEQVPIVAVQNRLGHSLASTTLDVYGHVLVSGDAQVLEAANALLHAS